jgi:hypothetical protein
MGCDIHCYVEYRNRSENKNWQDFGGRINPGRNYLMFSIMAGVRSWGDDDCVLFKPKGLPDDLGYASEHDNFLYITDTKCVCGESKSVTMETAERWVKSGCSVYKNNHEGKPTWVSHPDWHSHSWLSLEEYKQILSKYKELEQIEWERMEKERKERLILLEKHSKDIDSKLSEHSWLLTPLEHCYEPEYQAIEASMSKLEEMGYETRLVFWFDN